MTYTTRADLLARVEQYKRDIDKMNKVANAAARAQGYCEQWEAIIRKINTETLGRLGLKGRPGYPTVEYAPAEIPPQSAMPPIANCNCEICEQARREQARR